MTEPIDVRDKQPSPEQPLSELISNLTEDTSKLFRQEVALARAEIKQEASVAMIGVAMMAMAGALSAVALILLSLAAAEGLQRWLDIDIAWCRGAMLPPIRFSAMMAEDSTPGSPAPG